LPISISNISNFTKTEMIMVLLSRKAFNYYNLILLLFLQITLSSCSNIQSISRPFDTTSSKGKMIDYIETKNYLISNLSIQSSSNRDLQFALQQFNQSRFEVAEFYLKKTLVKFPGNPTAIRLLPWTYFYQKHYDRALKTFKRTKTLLKKNPEALVGMGWCYFALRNYEKAIEQFKSAKKINGNLYHINKGEGFAHLKLNKIAEQKKIFQKYTVPPRLIVFLSYGLRGIRRYECIN